MKTVVHNQTEFQVDTRRLERFCRELVDRTIHGQSLEELSLALVDDQEMSRLNDEYYGADGTTDVLAFPYEGDAEIVLNPYEYSRRTEEGNTTLNEEFVENLVHALLHLAGYDHTKPSDQGEHLRRQQAVVDQLKQRELPRLIYREGDDPTSAGKR